LLDTLRIDSQKPQETVSDFYEFFNMKLSFCLTGDNFVERKLTHFKMEQVHHYETQCLCLKNLIFHLNICTVFRWQNSAVATTCSRTVTLGRNGSTHWKHTTGGS